MTEYTLSQWLLFFYIYCFLGWVWESAYVSVCERKLVNRGFLKGPFLPIYGSGAICILVVTIPVRGNIPAMCIVGMVSAAVLEYVTGYVMERLFRVRYWDYTGKFLNINGYICLSSVLCWGMMTLLVVDVIHVRIEHVVMLLSTQMVDLIVLIATPFFTADFVTSFIAAMRLRDILISKERITEELKKLAEKKEELEAALEKAVAGKGEKAVAGKGEKAVAGKGDKAKEQIRQELQELYMTAGGMKQRLQIKYAKSIRGLLRRNPTAVSFKHRETFADLKRSMAEKLDGIRGEVDFSAIKEQTGKWLKR